MKAQLYDVKGTKAGDLTLPSVFDSVIREDITLKHFEIEKFNSLTHSTKFKEAGKRHSASGTISHRRHEWKGHYGKGISRVPRKAMWRRGTQFYWIAAEVSGTRGGRLVHGPTGPGSFRKLNRNEVKIAMNSAFAATANKDLVVKRYSSISKIDSAPIVVESMPQKTKEAIALLKNIFGAAFNVVMQNKAVRAGKGKKRGRKYKSNAGLLIITGDNEKVKLTGVDVKPIKSVSIIDLYPLGRLTLYTKKAIEEMSKENAK